MISEGESLARSHSVEYMEISVALNLSTDELLIATLAGVKASKNEISARKAGSNEGKRSLTPSCLSSPGPHQSFLHSHQLTSPTYHQNQLFLS